MRQREEEEVYFSRCLSHLCRIPFTHHLVDHRPPHGLIVHPSTRIPCEQPPVQKSLIIDLVKRKQFLMPSPPGSFLQVPVRLWGTKPFRWLRSPEGLGSMGALPVWAVMAHLEYNRHGCLGRARLVCLHALVHKFLLSFSSLPFTPAPPIRPHSSTCLLYVPSICLCQPP